MEMRIYQVIFTHKNMPNTLWENDFHTLKTGEKYCDDSSYLWRYIETLLFYSLYCICLCAPSFGTFPVSRFPVQSLLFTPTSCATWGSMRGTVHGARGGVTVWLVGTCSNVYGVTRACSLTCYPNLRLRVLVSSCSHRRLGSQAPWIIRE